MKAFLLLTALWAIAFVAAVPQPGKVPSPDGTTSTKKTTTAYTSTKTSAKTTPSSTKTSSNKSTSTAKPSSTTKKSLTSTTSSSTTKKSLTSTTSSSTKKSSTYTSSSSVKKSSTATPSSSKQASTTTKQSSPTSSTKVVTTSIASSTNLPSTEVTLPISSVVPTTVPDPGCGVRAGNIVTNGGFANGGDFWRASSNLDNGDVILRFDTADGATADVGNTNCFYLQIDDPFTGAAPTLRQTLCLVPGTVYTYSYLVGVDPAGATGDSHCSLIFGVNGQIIEPDAPVCGGTNLPADYGACTIPNADNPNVRYQSFTGTFTATSDSGTIQFGFSCTADGVQSLYPAALIDAVTITGE